MNKYEGRVAKKREKFDVAFLEFDDLAQIEKEKVGIQIGMNNYTFNKDLDFFHIKKIVTPVTFEIETPDGKIKVTEEDVLVMDSGTGKLSVVNKFVFENGYKEIPLEES